MGFRVKHGDMETVTKLAILTGEAIQGEKQQRLALDIAMRLQQQKQAQEMAEFNTMMQIESQKAQMQWQFQSQMLRQQNDFEMSEKLRMQEIEQQYLKDQRKTAEFEAAIKAIDDSEILSDADKDRMRTNTSMKFNMGPYAPQIQEQQKPFSLSESLKAQRMLEEDVDHYMNILAKYSETKDISWMPFSRGAGEGGLVVQDDEGEWHAASVQEKNIYDYAQMQLAQKMQQMQLTGSGPGSMAGGPGDVLGLGGI